MSLGHTINDHLLLNTYPYSFFFKENWIKDEIWWPFSPQTPTENRSDLESIRKFRDVVQATSHYLHMFWPIPWGHLGTTRHWKSNQIKSSLFLISSSTFYNRSLTTRHTHERSTREAGAYPHLASCLETFAVWHLLTVVEIKVNETGSDLSTVCSWLYIST